MSVAPEVARADLIDYLILALVDRLSLPVVESAIRAITADWSVELQTKRPVTDPQDRFVITTPWEPR